VTLNYFYVALSVFVHYFRRLFKLTFAFSLSHETSFSHTFVFLFSIRSSFYSIFNHLFYTGLYCATSSVLIQHLKRISVNFSVFCIIRNVFLVILMRALLRTLLEFCAQTIDHRAFV